MPQAQRSKELAATLEQLEKAIISWDNCTAEAQDEKKDKEELRRNAEELLRKLRRQIDELSN